MNKYQVTYRHPELGTMASQPLTIDEVNEFSRILHRLDATILRTEMIPFYIYRVTYFYRGEKYGAGTYDTLPEAQERSALLFENNLQSVCIGKIRHAHHKFCSHHLSIITWEERDGKHSSYATESQAAKLLEMIAEDDTMTLKSVVSA